MIIINMGGTWGTGEELEEGRTEGGKMGVVWMQVLIYKVLNQI